MKLMKKMNGKSKLNNDSNDNLNILKSKIEEKIKILEGLDNNIDILILKRNHLLTDIESSIMIYRKFKY